MRKMERKRLNNKGFTLIELLAVVVILAVVMGIAMTTVLSSMNKARGGSLEDTAMIIANGFNQKYTESLVGGVPSDVYAGTNEPLTANAGYNFQSSKIYYIDAKLADTFNISTSGYAMDSTGTATEVATNAAVSKSFVKFDVSTGKFVVCMFANKTGSYFVDNYKVTDTNGKAIGTTGVTAANGEMFACSDGSRSW